MSGPTTEERPRAPAGPTASDRARELRTSLGVQRDVGTMIAEASEMRARAAADADALVATAEEVAAKLIAETRKEAERILDDAQAEAAAAAARAEEERAALRAEIRAEVQAEVRAEVERERARTTEVVARAADRLRRLAPEVEDSLLVVTGALEALPSAPAAARDGAILVPVGDIGPDPDPDRGHRDTGVPDDEPSEDHRPDEAATRPSPTMVSVGAEARPLGWLFRSQHQG